MESLKAFQEGFLNTRFEKDGAKIEKDCRASTHALFWRHSSTAACLHQINAPFESFDGPEMPLKLQD